MDKILKDKVSIITGGSKGLGFASAKALAEYGSNIVLCSRHEDSLLKASSSLTEMGVEVLPIVADMGNSDDNYRIIDTTIKQFNHIDILVNNSGGPAAGTYSVFTDDDWRFYFEQVLLYNIRMTREASKYMKNKRWGRIINIASLSVKEPAASLVISNVFRAGVVAFAKSISKELIRDNITINNICPGAFKTERAANLIRNKALETGKSEYEIEQMNVSKYPQGRYQDCDELGSYVAYLCTEGASSITGTTLQIDGGISNCLL